MIKIIGLLFILIGLNTGYIQSITKEYVIHSPDKKLKLIIKQSESGDFTYRLSAYGTDVIDSSLLGYRSANGTKVPAARWKVENTFRNNVDRIWYPLWGKRACVPDKYNELVLQLNSGNNSADKFEIIARAYNDGIAFRYAFPYINSENNSFWEQTAYNFSSDYMAWFYNGEKHNIGPELLTLSEGQRFPVMTVKVNDNLFLALHEACLDNGEPLILASEKGERIFRVSSKPISLHSGFESPWRVIFCGKEPGVLVDSHLLELLNPDPEPGSDFSWVKPGIAVWDWRINGAEWEGFNYDMSFDSWVRMVDFASEQGFGYLVLDANWYGPEFSGTSDPVKGEKAEDVKKIIQYGMGKNVGIWLYLNDIGGRNYSLKETLQQYGKWGAAGVKYGFMTGNMIEKNIRTRLITEICAQNKLLVNFHDGPVHPYGQMRTRPNAVTREYCQAQLDGHSIFYPKTFVTSVFVNMLAGPLDMNNGMFDLRQGKTTRADNNQEIPSTIVSEAARTLITFSGVTIIPDIPEFYRKYPELLGFLSAQKMPWRESKTLSGEIGEYIVMMRQAEDGKFLVGAATNENERVLDIPLHFLGKGKYEALVIEDGDDAHYLHNREKYKISDKNVTRKDKLQVRLAPGGGACIILKQKSKT